MPNNAANPIQQWYIDQLNVLKYEWTLPFLASRLIPAFLNQVRWWWRQSSFTMHPETQALLESNTSVIFALWHGQMFALMHPAWVADWGLPQASLPPTVLISQSRDGDFIDTVAKHIGFPHTIRGAYGRGGGEAALKIQSLLKEKQGHLVCLMDGPKGPRHQVKKGVVGLAFQTGTPIIPVAGVSPQHWFKFNSAWDAFEVPSLFSPIHLSFGQPYYVPQAPESTDVLDEVNQALMTHFKETLSRFPKNPHNQSIF